MPAPFIVNFHMPIDAQDHEVTAQLQSMLVELIDLALIGKQAHWNVEGPHFRSLHLELDELVDTWRTRGDQVAERGVTLGAVPDGQAATVASFSQIAPLPAGHLRDYDVVREVADRVTEVAARARARVEVVASHDPASEDLLIASRAHSRSSSGCFGCSARTPEGPPPPAGRCSGYGARCWSPPPVRDRPRETVATPMI